jgi:hypothetical protein
MIRRGRWHLGYPFPPSESKVSGRELSHEGAIGLVTEMDGEIAPSTQGPRPRSARLAACENNCDLPDLGTPGGDPPVAVSAVARIMARSKTSLRRPAKGFTFGGVPEA